MKDDIFYCDWCSKGELSKSMDRVIYLDHVEVPSSLSTATICTPCQDAYDSFVASRDDK